MFSATRSRSALRCRGATVQHRRHGVAPVPKRVELSARPEEANGPYAVALENISQIESLASHNPEHVLAEAQKQYSYLDAPEYKPDQLWAAQFLNSATCLGCLAEFNGTEFHHALKAETLVKIYKDQLANYENNTVPRLQNEGISKVIIDKLHEIYHARAFVEAWEVDAAIVKYRSILGSKVATYRITESEHNFWPFWKSLVFKPFSRSMFTTEYLSTEKTLGRNPRNNAEAASINVRQFNGVVAFINAVNRGLSKEEITKVKAILQQGFPDRLSQSWKEEIEQEIVAIEKLSETDLHEAKRQATKLWKANIKKPRAKLYLLSRLGETFEFDSYKKLGRDDPFFGTDDHDDEHGHDDHHGTPTEEVTLVEGEDFFTSEASRQKHREELRLKLLQELDETAKAHPQEFSDKSSFAARFNEALKIGLSEEIQDNLHVLHLLRTSALTDRQQDEILSIFRPNPNEGPADGKVLLDALNPHPVAKALWAERIRALCLDLPEYTREFDEGSDSTWIKEANWPKGTHQLLSKPSFNSPPLNKGAYNTAFEDVCHMKLIRLAVDWLDLDLHTVEGMASFDALVHTYDISPGEDTLERTHPSPPDHHTYEELPIMKFDGWDDADEPDLYGDEDATKALGTGHKEVAAHH